MSAIPKFLLRHTVTVEPYLGGSPNGPAYGEPVQVRCFLEDSNQMLRNDDGHEVVSNARYFARLDTIQAPPGSRVTLPATGRQYSVITVRRHDGGGLPTPDHLEVALEVSES